MFSNDRKINGYIAYSERCLQKFIKWNAKKNHRKRTVSASKKIGKNFFKLLVSEYMANIKVVRRRPGTYYR